MGSEPYLKDFVRASVEDRLQSGRPIVINHETVDEVNQTYPRSSV